MPFRMDFSPLNKGNNKITELSIWTDKISQQPENCENRNTEFYETW